MGSWPGSLSLLRSKPILERLPWSHWENYGAYSVYLPTNLHQQAHFWPSSFFHLVLSEYAYHALHFTKLIR